ncbi:MAG: hypothetical protein US75_C0002G0025 [Candidatus Woesebacteria bacterium GW2011_GWC1_38_13]|uniref:Glycosyltransferase RgtA/B/C/D-like domain-containing protein n=3 Tax=Candidatus Woeseibacteriota TaxID=1752722 RepID=A0A0G0NE55_9BACT|nr:MAG: hypothetical protein US67_C0012G0002 [Candidatus Woesebacteria bacterium GW2011_GWD1_38_10]KKQ56827.1 MAG: hypothetical protein US75_C0002G0025 [Candidatus Woesebacteria bacterium GW2011_GWC1_38_13]KKQ84159.1 MAG: hypothetical protein UT06_C0009G0016 [Candidatus Woesebacteria bacterium GW2011_GWA1_38_8]
MIILQIRKLLSKNSFLLVIISGYLFLLTYLAVRKSFNLALSGDDWLMHWMTQSIFFVRKITSIWNPFAYLCTYCPHWPTLALMEHFWGYNPRYYYLISLILRATASIFIFISFKYVTKSAFLSLMAASFFAVGYTGIETTDWVFNFIHYAGVSFAMIFLIFYFKAKEKLNLRSVFIAAFFFLLALIISPPRMHGLLPLILMIEIGWLLIEGKKYNFKHAIFRVVIMFLVFRTLFVGLGDLTLFLRKYNIDIGGGHNVYGYGEQDWTLGRVVQGFESGKNTLESGRSEILLYPVITIGNYVMPDRLWKAIPFGEISILKKNPFTFYTYIFPITVFLGFLSLLVFKALNLKFKQYKYFYVFLMLLLFIVYLFKKKNIPTFPNDYVAYALIGGFTIILSMFLFFVLRKKEKLVSIALLMGLGLMIAPSVFPLLIDPLNILKVWGRYSLHQSVGVSVWFAVIFYLLCKNLKNKKSYLSLTLVIVSAIMYTFMQLRFTDSYLSDVSAYRSIEIDQYLWSWITREVPNLNKNSVAVFYLVSEQQDYLIAEWTLRFTFVGRAALHYQITNENMNPFMIVNNYKELFSTVTDGDRLVAQGKPRNPLVSIENVHAFHLKDQKLFNITDEVRKQLYSDNNKYLESHQDTISK